MNNKIMKLLLSTYLKGTAYLGNLQNGGNVQMIEVRTSEEELSHGPPLNVRVESAGPHALRVSWSPPLQPPPPTKYSIHYTEVSGYYTITNLPNTQFLVYNIYFLFMIKIKIIMSEASQVKFK